VHHFGEDRLIDGISPVDAEGFLDALEAGKLAGAREEAARGYSLGEQAVRHHIRNSKAIFTWAHAFRLVSSNPFAEYCGTPLPSKPNHYVSIEVFEALLAEAPSPGWRALFALCRLAGLRRGEALKLPWSGTMQDREGAERWVGVDWEHHRLCIVAVKTRIYREVPIGPRLHEILFEIRPREVNDHVSICGLSGNNLTRLGEKTAKAAGLEPWPKFYQAMRSSCENDWKQQGLAEPTYAAWLGHSPTVSRKHYVSPTEAEFAIVTEMAA
jgi:integrase